MEQKRTIQISQKTCLITAGGPPAAFRNKVLSCFSLNCVGRFLTESLWKWRQHSENLATFSDHSSLQVCCL